MNEQDLGFIVSEIGKDELRSAVLADGGFTGLFRAFRNPSSYASMVSRYEVLLEVAASEEDRKRRQANLDANFEQTGDIVDRETVVAVSTGTDLKIPDAHAAVLATTIFTTAFPNFLPPSNRN